MIRLTRGQARALAAIALTGDRQTAADLLGVSKATIANHLTAAFDRLGVDTAIEAFIVLDWLHAPIQLLDLDGYRQPQLPTVWFMGVS